VSTNRLALYASVAAVGVVTAFALDQAVRRNRAPDLFIYRAGAERGLRGESPYGAAYLRALVAAQYPDDPIIHENCGYFLPPLAVLAFAPFAAVPFPEAKLLWAVVTGFGVAGVLLVPRAFEARPLPRIAQLALPLVLAWNYLTFNVIELGQTSLVIAGCVGAGLWCFEHKRPTPGVLLWSVAFVKPHVALVLIPLAWYLGGWTRAAALVAVVAALNLVGATVVGGSPLFLRDYAAYLGTAHKAVLFNRAEINPEITSWNRLLYALTEPVAGSRFLIEQSAVTTVAGYAVWFGLAAARCRVARAWPSPAWATAAAAVGAVWCAQVLPYDLVLLVFVVPWVRELSGGGRRVRGWLVVALVVPALVPHDVFLTVGVPLHRPLGVALLAGLVLAGPVGATADKDRRVLSADYADGRRF
jgi:hypothetical protein